MNRFAPIFSAIFLAAMATVAVAQKPQLFPLEDLRPGMKGTARTVFSGTEPQEFGAEILAVLPGIPRPRQSAVIATLAGSTVDKTRAFDGLPGSPVYIGHRPVGAVPLSSPFP